MKNFTVKASALAIAAALPVVASAAPNTLTALTTPIYASELVSVGSLINNLPPIQTKIGFGVSATQERYLRFDLAGATFAVDPVLAVNAASDCTGGTPSAATVVIGGANDSSVVFQITAGASFNAASLVCLTAAAANGVSVDSVGGASIKYQLYATASDAAAGGSAGRLATASGSAFGVAPGFDYSITPEVSTVDVTTGYKQFSSGTTTTIGNVSISTTPGILDLLSGPADVLDFIGNAVNLTVVGGDLGSAALANNGVSFCGGAGSTKVTATSRKFSAVPVTVTGLDEDICYTATGLTPIAEQNFTVALDLTAVTGVAVSDSTAQLLGSFSRDGTVLKAPFISPATGQYTFIQVANVSTTAAPWSILCFGPAGPVGSGASGILPAGTTAKLAYSTLGCGDGTSAIELVLEATPGNVVGTLVRQSTSGGSTGLDGLTGNK